MSPIFVFLLVVGGEGFKCREVALEYGFKDVVVPDDIAWKTESAPEWDFQDLVRNGMIPQPFSAMNYGICG